MYGLVAFLLIATVGADYGMMNYGMMGGSAWFLIKLVYFALAAFVFSIVFWLTYAWLLPRQELRKPRRKKSSKKRRK